MMAAKEGPQQLLTSTEAAEYLGASPTSIKRWSDEGILPCVKTAGKHRRFAKADLDRFLMERMGGEPSEQGVVGPDTTAAWLDDLVVGRPYRLMARLFESRSELGSWGAVCDRVGDVLGELGEGWLRGEISVISEHLATERLTRALTKVGESLPVAADAPRALLLTLEDEEHTLGLALAELALHEIGWQTMWAGARTPLDGLGEALDANEVELLAVSASSCADDPSKMTDAARMLAEICEPRGVALVLGGSGSWPEPPPYGKRLRTFRSLSSAAPLPRRR